jgi:predicted secreted acid phosphatase
VNIAIATSIAWMLVGGGLAHAGEPQAAAAPEDIVAYRESGEWRADTRRAIRRARRTVERHRRDHRPAIVLDVDDTALSTYACMKAAGFDRAAAGCALRDDLPAVRDTARLFRYARAHGVVVFFVTGRREARRAVTVANLRRAGFSGYRGLRMRPDDQPARLKDSWKARVRRRIRRRGYRIVVNVGDQRSDLEGGCALRALNLPNPMYGIETA